ncbi:MAG: hypothetical protein ACI9MC_001978, partial [Kiritimatiellia bacterium]
MGAWTWCLLCASAVAGPVNWTMDPDLVPWETITVAVDGGRTPARSREDVQRRRARVNEFLQGSRTDRERAAAFAELGDLFRDEARLVLQQDAANPWRIPLRTTPAWLQLELALKWYDQSSDTAVISADSDGRLLLLKAVLRSRLGMGEPFDDYVTVIKNYRGTPYVEMAKLAVGDHHYRHGRLDKAEKAYRLVRTHRDVDLSSYARYRLASVYARRGDGDQAEQILVDLAKSERPGPLSDLLRDASRSALANHLAQHQSLPAMLDWLAGVCDPLDDACQRNTRQAAVDGYEQAGDERAAAWLRTVDAVPLVNADPSLRVALAGRMLADEPVIDVIFAGETLCPQADDACRAEVALAVAEYYEEIADPDGAWIMDYARLPRVPGRPDAARLSAALLTKPTSPEKELAAFEALCTKAVCAEVMRRHLRVSYGRLSRQMDAVWLQMVEHPPVVPGGEQNQRRMQDLVSQRASARESLDALEPNCVDAACRDTLFVTLASYYAETGQDRQASWLMA